MDVMIETACLQCGTPAGRSLASFCRRCGLPFGERPRSDVELPSCPICYRVVDDDGRLPSLASFAVRVDLFRHRAEHDTHPVGDDDWLESLREGDRIRIGRWSAPFDVIRRYLVTGQVEAGRGRALAHDAIVNAMTQIGRWGPNGVVFGDQPEWAAARAAVTALMERYARGRR
jgi:Zn-finger nucleic acid-binding protein